MLAWSLDQNSERRATNRAWRESEEAATGADAAVVAAATAAAPPGNANPAISILACKCTPIWRLCVIVICAKNNMFLMLLTWSSNSSRCLSCRCCGSCCCCSPCHLVLPEVPEVCDRLGNVRAEAATKPGLNLKKRRESGEQLGKI